MVPDRHGSDTVSESERCSDTIPICVGAVSESERCSDTISTPVRAVSESERCSDTIPTRDRSRIGAKYQ